MKEFKEIGKVSAENSEIKFVLNIKTSGNTVYIIYSE